MRKVDEGTSTNDEPSLFFSKITKPPQTKNSFECRKTATTTSNDKDVFRIARDRAAEDRAAEDRAAKDCAAAAVDRAAASGHDEDAGVLLVCAKGDLMYGRSNQIVFKADEE